MHSQEDLSEGSRLEAQARFGTSIHRKKRNHFYFVCDDRETQIYQNYIVWHSTLVAIVVSAIPYHHENNTILFACLDVERGVSMCFLHSNIVYHVE